ncbi:MAG: DUF3422 domain-containing protein [Proteobacteria bacterium]|nr:DUF3422 domain-containing protein [Pseudomonadota bacterium]MCL2308287.1 DUF3422 domain-containing protein [Pseudomonadota bacterium]
MTESASRASPLRDLNIYPLRDTLDREFHARPHENVQPPLRVIHLVMLSEPSQEEQTQEHVARLCKHFGVAVPTLGDAAHFSARCSETLSLKWERHQEFSTYTFFLSGAFSEPFSDAFETLLLTTSLGGIPGDLLVAVQIAFEPTTAPTRSLEQLHELFETAHLVGSEVSNGNARVFSDFLASHNGFSRILVRDHQLTGHQPGRLVQRLLDIETYRAMAILGFPRMRSLTQELSRMEQHLSDLTASMSQGADHEHDKQILQKLMRLAGETEHISAASAYRFSAGRAYHALVRHRLEELRETRIEGLPPIHEFLERRFAPAMRTIEAAHERLERLSKRVARAATLLRTTVDVALAEQNSALLASMDRRVKMQLRLQEMVEGLSIVVIGYYLTGLLGYGYKALAHLGVPMDVDIAIATTIPFVLLGIWLTVRWRRKKLMETHPGTPS